MQEELARRFGLVVLQVAEGILVYVGVIQEDLVVLDPRKSVADLASPGE